MAIAPVASVFAEDIKVAMVTDYGDINDQSFNQNTYEACKYYCDENGVDFTYYKPEGDSTADRAAMIDMAVDFLVSTRCLCTAATASSEGSATWFSSTPLSERIRMFAPSL